METCRERRSMHVIITPSRNTFHKTFHFFKPKPQTSMTIDTLRRFLLPCFFPSKPQQQQQPLQYAADHQGAAKTRPSSPASSTSSSTGASRGAAPRPSKSMVIGTIFGNRRGHVWFCVQHDRLSAKPLLLLELPLSTDHLVREMRNGLLRIALECAAADAPACPLRRVPLWTAFCNGKKTGFAARRRAGDRVRAILRTMHCVTVGAGVIPSGFGSSGSATEELMYMRANFEHVVGNADSESFHLINPDECPAQELSVFLLRSRLGAAR